MALARVWFGVKSDVKKTSSQVLYGFSQARLVSTSATGANSGCSTVQTCNWIWSVGERYPRTVVPERTRVRHASRVSCAHRVEPVASVVPIVVGQHQTDA